MGRFWGSLSFVVFFILQFHFQNASKSVNIVLKSNWNFTPLEAEICEFFAQHGGYWSTVFVVHNYHKSHPQATEKEVFDHLSDYAKQKLSPELYSLFLFSLSNRYFSPRVQAHSQIVQEDLIARGISRSDLSCPNGFLVVGDGVFCTLSEAVNKIAAYGDDVVGFEAKSEELGTRIYPFDHLYPSSISKPGPAFSIFLYAELSSPLVVELNEFSQNTPAYKYVLRYLAPVDERRKVLLSGYGTNLAFKNVEYKAVDDSKKAENASAEQRVEEPLNENEEIEGFNFAKLVQRKSELKTELLLFRDSLLSSKTNEEFHKLQPWDIKNLGVQTSQRILLSSNPLKTLRDITQHFPSYAASLSRLPVNTTIKDDIYRSQASSGITEGENVVLINGRIVNADDVDPFNLIDAVSTELQKYKKLEKLFLSPATISSVLSLPFSFEAGPTNIFDIRSEHIVWLNDLESDDMYHGWGTTVRDVLRPNYMGQPYFIAKNLITVVVGINLATDEGMSAFIYLARLIFQQAPIRVGFIFYTQSNPELKPVSDLLCKAFIQALRIASPPQVMNAFAMYIQERDSTPRTEEDLEALLPYLSQFNIRFSLDTVANDPGLANIIEKSNEFWVSRGFAATKFPIGFLNGVYLQDGLTDTLVGALFEQYPMLQSLVRSKVLNDEVNIYEVLLSQPGVLKRLNPYIAVSQADLKNLKLVSMSVEKPSNPLAPQTVAEKVHNIFSHAGYVSSPALDNVKTSSYLLAIDFSSARGLSFASSALSFLMGNSEEAKLLRVAFLDNSPHDTLVYQAYLAAIRSSQLAKKLVPFLVQLFSDAQANSELSKDQILTIAKAQGLSSQFTKYFEEKQNELISFSKEDRSFCQQVLGLVEGQRGIWTNGRVISINNDFHWEASDFGLLISYEEGLIVGIKSFLVDGLSFNSEVSLDDLTSSFQSQILMTILSELYEQGAKGVKKIQLPARIKFHFSTSNPAFREPVVHVEAILNPVTKTAQKMSAILNSLVETLPAKVSLLLNPPITLNSLPLKSFYRYVIASPSADLQFDRHGVLSDGPSASMGSLPTAHLMELTVDVPEAWQVQSVDAEDDLDNIQLNSLGHRSTLYAEFQLEHIMVTGSCSDLSSRGYPPQGLELDMGVTSNPHLVDTLVMNNFGYFQLKSNPGAWLVSMAKGKANDLYTFDGGVEKYFVVVDSFQGQNLYLPVKKRPGKEKMKLLIDEKEEKEREKTEGSSSDEGVWNFVGGLFGEAERGATKRNESDKIHVFSIASGHLYERFLRIMMLSVVKNTKTPVKFWFLKNYLSPQFKNSIQQMAAHYGFEVELVTYKWPAWLHRQTEKQRIIWAYKILFLDVLFPLDVNKIIFVDADQVVRGDLKDLRDLDLKGAALGYTAFCDSRKEMEGFRFWKQGYWKNHLRGRPYHISALYVVDLKRFRLIAAGDRLRAHYDSLARDPNSLSNLDQDLPNYMQHQIRIHTLPKDWLWCETWCDDESKKTAKTIDLCNNPMTKTPKLENAVRIIPEWTSLDNEVKAFEKGLRDSA